MTWYMEVENVYKDNFSYGATTFSLILQKGISLATDDIDNDKLKEKEVQCPSYWVYLWTTANFVEKVYFSIHIPV